MNPTPRPHIRRPGTIRAIPVEAVSNIHPIANTTQPVMIVMRRPIKSATSPAIIAPKKVPAERIEVTSDCFHGGITNALTAAASLGSGY
jgi:hypothetical protein